MKLAIYKCKPYSQFHFGSLAVDTETALNISDQRLHSDTLFSALVNEYLNVWGVDSDFNKFIEAFDSNRILISSFAYCLLNKNRMLLFFPKPVHASLLVNENFKVVKRIRFVSQKIVEEGILPHSWLNEKECTILKNGFVCTNSELEGIGIKPENFRNIRIYTDNEETKVKVHSLSQEDVLYNQTNLQIANNHRYADIDVGMWFTYSVENCETEIENRFTFLIEHLQTVGVGGQRSTGCGTFDEYLLENIEYSVTNNDLWLSLSLMIPKDDTDFQHFRYYDIKQRGGRFTGSVADENNRLLTVQMLTEGAVMNTIPVGKIENLRNKNHSVDYLRCGKGIAIPLHKNFEYK